MSVLTAALLSGLWVASAAGASSGWTRVGLEFVRVPPPPPPVVDRARMSRQIGEGCIDGGVRYAGSAAMRGVLDVPPLPETARRLASASAIADEAGAAQSRLAEARATAGPDPLAQALLANLEIETALQFGAVGPAAARLEEPVDQLPAPLRSDRLFWRALLAARTAESGRWDTEIRPLLEAAHAADPSSFQVRAWRILAWLEARSWRSGASCSALAAQFSELVLDATEESACPLMIGHLDHALSRALRARPEGPPGSEAESWRLFASGLLAALAGHADGVAQARADLERGRADLACRVDMVRGLVGIEDLAR